MIYTITLNPALDHVIKANKIEMTATNYYSSDYQVIGGKGINIAIVLNNLATDVLATGMLGHDNKQIFLDNFKQLNLKTNFFYFNGKTRTNFKIKDLHKQTEMELNSVGPTIDHQLLAELLQFLENKITAEDIVVASGKLANGLDSDTYLKIAQTINSKQATFILDTTGQGLLTALPAKPFLIKPNLAELCTLVNQPYQVDYNLGEISNMVQNLQKLGAQNVIISLGANGSYFFSTSGAIYQIGVAKGQLINSVGAGDSMVAGFIYGLTQQFDIVTTLKYSAGAGCATAFTSWLATKQAIEALIPDIKVTKVN